METIESLSFADENKNPVELATTTNNDHCILERLFYLNNVSAVNSSTNMSMSPTTKSPKSNSSNAVPTARPFDEFSADITTSASPFDGQGFGTTKSDKD